MDIIDVIGFICLAVFIGILLVQFDNENQKEIELIKNTQEYVMYDNCYKLDESWYCYNEK